MIAFFKTGYTSPIPAGYMRITMITAFHLHRVITNEFVENEWLKANDKIKLKSFNYLVKTERHGVARINVIFQRKCIEMFLDLFCLHSF